MKWSDKMAGVVTFPRLLLALAFIVVLFYLAACGTQQKAVVDRNAAIGQRTGSSNYFEAKQVDAIEQWKDDPSKIVLMYINFPPGSDNVISVQCQGVPASSTESLEPNGGAPYRDASLGGSTEYWVVPIDGVDVRTNEMAGRDGTFGEPVPYRQCLTTGGAYIDLPSMGVPYIVSSTAYTFPPSTVKPDFEANARMLAAEQLIRSGKCVNYETLLEIPCPSAPGRPAIPNATDVVTGTGDTP